jgi:competence protein ComFC
MLGSEERVKELKNAFIINNNIIDLRNKNILLVDDIFTTGATVNEISKLLKLKNINKVYVITFLTRI